MAAAAAVAEQILVCPRPGVGAYFCGRVKCGGNRRSWSRGWCDRDEDLLLFLLAGWL